MNKIELESLAELRIKEAKILLDAKCYHGAYYLAGYAVECLLKACIAKQIKQFDFPNKQLANDCYTHNLTKLIATAGLRQKLTEEESQNQEFELNWATVNKWSEEKRYECNIKAQDAHELFNAIIDNDSGILIWLKNYL